MTEPMLCKLAGIACEMGKAGHTADMLVLFVIGAIAYVAGYSSDGPGSQLDGDGDGDGGCGGD